MKKNKQKRFAPLKEIALMHPAFHVDYMRYLIRHAEKNGLDKCIRKVGRKIFINLDDFEEWIDSSKK